MKLDLNLLVIFDAIMREGSVSRAAGQLAMTQPAVSNALSRMRATFGDPVFIKDGRGVSPTPFATSLWQQVRANLQQLRDAVDPQPFDPQNTRQAFRLGVSDLIVDIYWSRLRGRVEREAPGVDIVAVPFTMATVESSLLNAEVDFVVAQAGPNMAPQLKHLHLFDSYFACAMGNHHPLAQKPLSLADYAQADHLMVSLSGDTQGVVDCILSDQDLCRRVAMTTNHFSAVPKLLKETNLIATLPFSAIFEYSTCGELWVTKPPVELPTKPVSLIWHERNERNPAHRWLRQAMAEITEELKAENPLPQCLLAG
ncbi:LysR family transcriptional regulator [Gallaecimonas kandeliae]|uniref:LysR family transcriptional regulator n=1 Tax=Gallaecimonas kandeliae TaxID=3029055 RepID=UPI002648E383|nr:LysR family transcriptional regulator [Gallaecimonas kandeliae]WKE64082.1 LysR family transcriptional regulator [Gallaecimonas kandeliae]